MISPRISIPSIVITVVLLSAAIGVVTVQASPACRSFVRNYVTVPVRNRVSKATAMAWAKWRVGHPNWKPNPKVKRPGYVMTREEAMDKVNFACENPAMPFIADSDRAPLDLEDTPTGVDLLDFSASQIAFQGVTPSTFSDEIAAEAVAAPAGEGGTAPVAGSWPSPSFSIPAVPGSVPPSAGVPTSPTSVPSSPPNVTSESMPVVDATPEPCSLLLVASGMGAGWLFCRRRREA
jgi:hypothetical protein